MVIKVSLKANYPVLITTVGVVSYGIVALDTYFKPLRTSDATWRHGYGSTLSQVMAC